jgi:hypothetical protein
MGRNPHKRAEATHERAANTHERAAQFWDEHDDPARASSERVKAEADRRGADLERERTAEFDASDHS